MKTAAEFWDKVAERYASQPIGDMDAYEATLAHARRHLRATDRALELGCGTGMTALRLAPAVASYVATDVSPGMITVGKRKAEGTGNVEFRTASADDPGATPASLDAVLAFNLLHLLHDLDGTLATVHSVLKPGGLFISKTFLGPGPGAPFKLRLMMLVLPLMQWLGKAPFVRLRNAAELEGAIVSAGFEIVERADYPRRPPRRFIVARKI